MTLSLNKPPENYIASQDQVRIVAGRESLVLAAIEDGFSESDARDLGEIAERFWRSQIGQLPHLTEDFLKLSFKQANIRLDKLTKKEKERRTGLWLSSDLIQRGEVVGIRE